MSDYISKAFFDKKSGLWLMPLRPGKAVPEGALPYTGKSGGKYYYFREQQGPQAGLGEAPQPQAQVPGQEGQPAAPVPKRPRS